MPQFLQRWEVACLVEWASRRGRKPLIVRGARQVGKSTLVRQFAHSAGMPLVEVDFERNPELRDAFLVKDPMRILETLGLLMGRTVAESDLLFLDEIQAAPEALTALRYFHEELPQLHVVAAGSLLEAARDDLQLPMPVGRVEYLHMGPMAFEDFLIAAGQAPTAALLRSLALADLPQALPAAVHERCVDMLRRYSVVGGLPEAVAAYVEDDEIGRAFERVARIQQSVVATYRDDFNKYSHGRHNERVRLVFDRLPALIGRKFKFAHVSRDHRAADLSDALRHLGMARVAAKVHRTAANGVPLSAEASERDFKCLYMDVGLMCAALQLNVLDLAREDFTLVNKGAVAEQLAGQCLLYSGRPYEQPSLHYWMREARNAAAEVDYVIAVGQRVIPVEVKAGATGSLKSLHQFLAEKRSAIAIRLHAQPPSLLHDAKKLPNGTTAEYRLLSLPLYLAGQTRRLAGEWVADLPVVGESQQV